MVRVKGVTSPVVWSLTIAACGGDTVVDPGTGGTVGRQRESGFAVGRLLWSACQRDRKRREYRSGHPRQRRWELSDYQTGGTAVFWLQDAAQPAGAGELSNSAHQELAKQRRTEQLAG